MRSWWCSSVLVDVPLDLDDLGLVARRLLYYLFDLTLDIRTMTGLSASNLMVTSTNKSKEHK